jgi:hypothetical protein
MFAKLQTDLGLFSKQERKGRGENKNSTGSKLPSLSNFPGSFV